MAKFYEQMQKKLESVDIESFPQYFLDLVNILRDADKELDTIEADKTALEEKVSTLESDLETAQEENMKQLLSKTSDNEKNADDEPEEVKEEDITFDDIVKDGERTKIEF